MRTPAVLGLDSTANARPGRKDRTRWQMCHRQTLRDFSKGQKSSKVRAADIQCLLDRGAYTVPGKQATHQLLAWYRSRRRSPPPRRAHVRRARASRAGLPRGRAASARSLPDPAHSVTTLPCRGACHPRLAWPADAGFPSSSSRAMASASTDLVADGPDAEVNSGRSKPLRVPKCHGPACQPGLVSAAAECP